jgi:hypothetical protein
MNSKKFSQGLGSLLGFILGGSVILIQSSAGIISVLLCLDAVKYNLNKFLEVVGYGE